MLCSNCGQDNDQRLRFCTGCGASLTGAPPPQPPPQTTPQPTPRAPTNSSSWKKILLAAACLVALGVGVGIAVRLFGGGDPDGAGRAGGASSGGATVTATPSPTPSLDFDKIYTGTVGGNFNVEMRLRRDGESLSGSFFHRPAREEPGR